MDEIKARAQRAGHGGSARRIWVPAGGGLKAVAGGVAVKTQGGQLSAPRGICSPPKIRHLSD
eukprot:381847-Prorocentrum_minimum.AAC.2